jgi:hypothetical protein
MVVSGLITPAGRFTQSQQLSLLEAIVDHNVRRLEAEGCHS